jgi:YbgC/YbaW family acyl-CoA thioester hydrolase
MTWREGVSPAAAQDQRLAADPTLTLCPPMAAIYKRRVEFAETDMAGQVHFSVFFRYMEEAEHAVWRKAGMRIATEGREHQWPRISAHCDFKSRLRVDDEFEVRTEMAKVSARTIQWAHTIVRGETLIASGSVTAVCVKVQVPRLIST